MKGLRSKVILPVCPFATFIIHNYITHLTSLLATPLVMLKNEDKVPQSFETSLATLTTIQRNVPEVLNLLLLACLSVVTVYLIEQIPKERNLHYI